MEGLGDIAAPLALYRCQALDVDRVARSAPVVRCDELDCGDDRMRLGCGEPGLARFVGQIDRNHCRGFSIGILNSGPEPHRQVGVIGVGRKQRQAAGKLICERARNFSPRATAQFSANGGALVALMWGDHACNNTLRKRVV